MEGPGASVLRGVGRANSHIFESGRVDGLVILGFDRLLLVVALGIPVSRALSRSRHAAAAAKFVAPPPPTLADRRAVAAAADILGQLSAWRGVCGQLVIYRGEYS